MVQEETVMRGTVVDGRIVPDAGPSLPDGTRVWFGRANEEADDFGDLSQLPPDTGTYEEHIAALKKSIADMEAGEQGKSVEEVFDALERDFGIRSTGDE